MVCPCCEPGRYFFALSFESHGRLSEPAIAFLCQLANASGFTVAERSGFMRWALTLLHITNMRGVAAVICANRRFQQVRAYSAW